MHMYFFMDSVGQELGGSYLDLLLMVSQGSNQGFDQGRVLIQKLK